MKQLPHSWLISNSVPPRVNIFPPTIGYIGHWQAPYMLHQLHILCAPTPNLILYMLISFKAVPYGRLEVAVISSTVEPLSWASVGVTISTSRRRTSRGCTKNRKEVNRSEFSSGDTPGRGKYATNLVGATLRITSPP